MSTTSAWLPKRSQLAFRRELAKFLIPGYNGYKRPSSSGKRAIQTLTCEENLAGHFLEKLQGKKKACAMCSKAGRKRSEGRTFVLRYFFKIYIPVNTCKT